MWMSQVWMSHIQISRIFQYVNESRMNESSRINESHTSTWEWVTYLKSTLGLGLGLLTTSCEWVTYEWVTYKWVTYLNMRMSHVPEEHNWKKTRAFENLCSAPPPAMAHCRASLLLGHPNRLDIHMWHASFIRVTWLIHMCDMTHSHAPPRHLYAICVIHVCHDSFRHVTWIIHMHCLDSHTGHESFICVTWLIQISDMTHPYALPG